MSIDSSPSGKPESLNSFETRFQLHLESCELKQILKDIIDELRNGTALKDPLNQTIRELGERIGRWTTHTSKRKETPIPPGPIETVVTGLNSIMNPKNPEILKRQAEEESFEQNSQNVLWMLGYRIRGLTHITKTKEQFINELEELKTKLDNGETL